MELIKLLEGIKDYKIKGDEKVEITNIAYDSRKVRKGSVFVCIKGFVSDGHDYIEQAIKSNAAAIIVEDESQIKDVTIVKVDNSRRALAVISSNFFENPSGKINMIGVTGTKGKTTTTFMIDSILAAAGEKTAVLGTILNKIDDEVLYASRTTPESYDLQSMLYQCVRKKVRHCIMEVSSQGLWLDRVYGCRYSTGVYTNIYNDHIGPNEHRNMQEYMEAKSILFQRSKNGVINIDADGAEYMIQTLQKNPHAKLWTYGINNEAMIHASNIRPVSEKERIGTGFFLESPWYKGDIFVAMPGRFNVYNSLAAIVCAGIEGVDFEYVKKGLAGVSVRGRMQPVKTGMDFQVIVDYAHNSASLENLLLTLREHTKGKIICVFGCGGDRAKSRRFEMGEVSGKLSDYTIITSDNPRTELPEKILADIETGVKKTSGKYVKIADRTEAIRHGIINAKKDDIVVIAGKGHETYQIFSDKTIHYDDVEEAGKIIEELNDSI